VDAAIIAAAQKAEHIEIASYGTVHAWAQQLGQEDAADLLAATLDEEKAANETLSRIARSSANRTAMARQP
jgi:ferritin-like metal-binding protein YciE